MSVEIPEQSPEKMNDSQFERIKFLLNVLEFTPELCEDLTYVFDKNEYPELLAEHGFDCVEVDVQETGEVEVTITYPRSDTEHRIDTYVYVPSERMIVHGSAVSSVNEQLVDLQEQFEELQEKLHMDYKTAQNNYEAMMDIVRDMDDHTTLLTDYDVLKELIADWRKMVFDTDKENTDWQHSLDVRETKNEMEVGRLLEKLSITNVDIDELWQPYCAARLGMELSNARLDTLADQIDQLSNVKTSEVVAIVPQDFIDLMEMLLQLIQDSFDQD